MNNELLFKDEVYAIQGAIFEVYKHMGNGWGFSLTSALTRA